MRWDLPIAMRTNRNEKWLLVVEFCISSVCISQGSIESGKIRKRCNENPVGRCENWLLNGVVLFVSKSSVKLFENDITCQFNTCACSSAINNIGLNILLMEGLLGVTQV